MKTKYRFLNIVLFLLFMSMSCNLTTPYQPVPASVSEEQILEDIPKAVQLAEGISGYEKVCTGVGGSTVDAELMHLDNADVFRFSNNGSFSFLVDYKKNGKFSYEAEKVSKIDYESEETHGFTYRFSSIAVARISDSGIDILCPQSWQPWGSTDYFDLPDLTADAVKEEMDKEIKAFYKKNNETPMEENYKILYLTEEEHSVEFEILVYDKNHCADAVAFTPMEYAIIDMYPSKQFNVFIYESKVFCGQKFMTNGIFVKIERYLWIP